MTAAAERMIEDLQKMLTDIDELAKAVLQEESEGNGEVSRVANKLMEARTKATELKNALVRRVQGANSQVHDNPWASVGAAAVLAFAIGVLVGRSR